MQKSEIREFLGRYQLQPITEAAKKDRSIIRMLISLVYDKENLESWRAIEAIGLVAGEIAKTNVDLIRNLCQRFLWMMRDESGNGPGSAPELLGEIVRSTPDAFADIGQVITSFYDEKMLRRGVMRAIWRIVDIRPDLLTITQDLRDQKLCLDDDDAGVRAYSLMIAGAMSLQEFRPTMEGLMGDMSQVTIYNKGEFMNTTVSEIANKVVAGLQGKASL
ncbi:MAG: hypothetical protein HZB31_06565 [Nitrospirae bacterium]|nr:hypothetical protein [Nitrospirota bacterium]